MLEPAAKADDITRSRITRLQGTRQWETVWETLVEFAEREELCKISLDLNVPWLEEGFHGAWHRSKQPDRLERWSACLPIHAGDRIAGRLDVVGPARAGISLPTVAKLVELLDDLTPQVELLIATEPVLDSARPNPEKSILDKPSMAPAISEASLTR